LTEQVALPTHQTLNKCHVDGDRDPVFLLAAAGWFNSQRMGLHSPREARKVPMVQGTALFPCPGHLPTHPKSLDINLKSE
jgi:hypothetical protein